MATLIVSAGPSEGAFYRLGKRATVIGRHETCPFQIVDERVSGEHIQIRYEEVDKSYRLLDMKSMNGTVVQNQRLEREHKLADNDEISIGNSRLMFSIEDFPDKASAIMHVKKLGQKNRPAIEQR